MTDAEPAESKLRYWLNQTAIGLLIGLVIGVVLLVARKPAGTPIQITTASSQIMVQVSGEVQSPGIYALPRGARLADAITAAGGLTAAADATSVNQVERLYDGLQVHVAAIGAAPIQRNIDLLLNINQATLAELETLPDIGETRAQAILDYRAANGAFESIEELLDVPGIGQSTFEKLKPLIAVR